MNKQNRLFSLFLIISLLIGIVSVGGTSATDDSIIQKKQDYIFSMPGIGVGAIAGLPYAEKTDKEIIYSIIPNIKTSILYIGDN